MYRNAASKFLHDTAKTSNLLIQVNERSTQADNVPESIQPE